MLSQNVWFSLFNQRGLGKLQLILQFTFVSKYTYTFIIYPSQNAFKQLYNANVALLYFMTSFYNSYKKVM